MRALLVLSTLAAGVVAALGLAGGAGGAQTRAAPWPVARILVWNDTGYVRATAQAMSAWNRVGTRVTFAPAASPSAARVVVGYLEQGREGQLGEGSVGWSPGRAGSVSVRRGLSPRLAAAVIAHELGHVLGLDHRPERCSVMNGVFELGSGSGSRCPLARCPDVSSCLVQPGEAAALVDLYERRLPSLVPSRVTDVVGTVPRDGRRTLVVRWRSPSSGPGGAVLVRAVPGRCPSSAYGAPLARTFVFGLERGAQQEAWVPVTQPGRWCAGVWVQETSSYITGPGVRLWLDVR